MNMLREEIQKAHDKGATASEIENKFWPLLTEKEREQFGRSHFRQLIAVAIRSPYQIEFAIDGDPFPLERVPAAMLEERGRRLIVAGRKMIERGEAYLEAAKEQKGRDSFTPAPRP